VADVVSEGDRLDEVLVEPEGAADCAGNLRNKLDMDHPVGDMIVIDEIKDLCFVDIPGIRPGMDDPVCIAGVRSPDIFFSPVMPAKGVGARCSERREKRFPLADI
jgi:hypothetical protein